jgi:transcriptional regulator with XRE-family HTH domain
MDEVVAARLGENIRGLREARGLTQQQISKLAAVPRATWATLESGSANPTLAVLIKVANALQVRVEELIGPPRVAAQHFPAAKLSVRVRGKASIRRLLPEALAGLDLERMELPEGAHFTGVPHTPGTREYLTCERGQLELAVSGERFLLAPGDVVVFQGDQRHGYRNPGRGAAVGYSVVAFAPLT